VRVTKISVFRMAAGFSFRVRILCEC
jgi:hypothetical protein